VVPKGRKPDSRVVSRGPAGRGVGPRGVGPWGVGPRGVGGVDIEMMSMPARRREGGGDEAGRLGRRRQPPHKSHRTVTAGEDHEARQQRCPSPRGSSRPASATRHHDPEPGVDERKGRLGSQLTIYVSVKLFDPCSREHNEHLRLARRLCFVFLTTQSCVRGHRDTHLSDLNHSSSQTRGHLVPVCHVTGEIVGFREPLFPPVLFTTHILRLLLPLCLLCFPACLVFLLPCDCFALFL
jgi:hypothetical protein